MCEGDDHTFVCMDNYIHYKVWDETTYSYPDLNGASVLVNSSHILLAMQLNIRAGIEVKPCY